MDAPIYRFDQYEPRQTQSRRPGGISLEITRGQARQKLRAVRERVFLIGTSSDCDLVLGDLSFPEAYAYLFVDGEKVSIRRLGAGPLLLVCGEVVETAVLLRGDLVKFGPFELRVVMPGPQEIPAAATAGGLPAPEDLDDLPLFRMFEPKDMPCQFS